MTITRARYEPPSRQIVYEGFDVATALDQALREFWIANVVLVTDRAAAASGLLSRLNEGLEGHPTAQITIQTDHPNRKEIVSVARALRNREVQGVVVFGGGRH